MDVRVLVYNLRQFRDDPAAAARAVAGVRADLALLQEVGTRRRLHRFSRSLEMEPAHASLSPLLRRVRSAVLVRPPWRIVQHHLQRFERSERFHPRGALVVQVGRSGFRIWALSVHLGLVDDERRRHAMELTDLAASLRGPLLIGGDLNETPDRLAARWIGERYFDAWPLGAGPEETTGGDTFPAGAPTARIDYLFCSAGFRVERAVVLDGPDVRLGSDHRPLVVDLTLTE